MKGWCQLFILYMKAYPSWAICKNIDISLPFTAYIRQNNPKFTLSWPPFYWTHELHHGVKFKISRIPLIGLETRLGWRTDRKCLRNPNPNLNEIRIATRSSQWTWVACQNRHHPLQAVVILKVDAVGQDFINRHI
jgi:hypothetical protein